MVQAQMNTLSSRLLEDSQSSYTTRDKIFPQVMGEDNHGCYKMYYLKALHQVPHGPHPTRCELMELRECRESQNCLMVKDISNLKSKVDSLIQATGHQIGAAGGAVAILSAISMKV